MSKSVLRTYASIFLLVLICTTNVQADLILSAPPRESLQEGNKLYGPLAKHLSSLLDEQVTYQHPDNWLHYQRELRNDVYDIVFDGPHFVSWRLKHLKHSVLLKLPGTLEFYIVAKNTDDKITELKDLIGKKICGISPPNLATMTLIDQFRNPVRQPNLLPVRGGFSQVFKSFDAGDCRAAVVRTTYFDKKLSAESRLTNKTLFQSTPLPNQAISVSTRVNTNNRKKIVDSLTHGEGINITRTIVSRFGGKKAKSFIPASANEYQQQASLLEGVVFGW